MFSRDTLEKLKQWKEKPDRKPLVLRGARQVGKTTLVTMFSGFFDQYIYLNLEKSEDLKIFDPARSFQDVVTAIFFLKGKTRQQVKTLIFIDEIQNSAEAVKWLRFFYEETPDLHVIAAGSILETLLDNRISFPVGRVEYLAVKPCSFSEFLSALGEINSLEIIQQFPVPDFAHEQLRKLFNLYTLIGGMPGVIQHYAEHRDLTMLTPVYDSLLVSYLDDVEKYARNNTLLQVIRHVTGNAFQHFGTRITFERFGNSNYRSREVGEAFRTLEKAMLLQLIYPAEYPRLPLYQNFRKSPRLQMLDTGLVNYFSGIQKEVFEAPDITAIYRGRIAEHVVGQELMAGETSVLSKLHFWTREQRNSQAEIDYLFVFEGQLIPIEVKSGGSGKLKSMQLFMDQVQHKTAIRFWSAKSSIETVFSMEKKRYSLINLPLYLAGNLTDILKRYV
jgi:predicted AAA+ superfamily ATPase